MSSVRRLRQFFLTMMSDRFPKMKHMSGTASSTSIHSQVQRFALAQPTGTPFGIADLPRSLQRRSAAVYQALSRLVQAGALSRVLRGLYVVPQQTIFGEAPPAVSRVVAAYAHLHHLRLGVHGAVVLNELGLSTQVPGRALYLASIHRPRQLELAAGPVTLAPAPKAVLAALGTPAEALVAGLSYLGRQQRGAGLALVARLGEVAWTAARTLPLPRWMKRLLPG